MADCQLSLNVITLVTKLVGIVACGLDLPILVSLVSCFRHHDDVAVDLEGGIEVHATLSQLVVHVREEVGLRHLGLGENAALR